MKKLLALAAAITLLCTAALAEFDFYALKDTPDAMTYTVPGTADTVVRPALAPYQGEFGEDELVAYLDYIILPDEEVATFRLCLSLSMFDSFQADEVRVTVDKKCYTFAVKPAITDYDGIYMEDYTLVLSSESFPIVTALSALKKKSGTLSAGNILGANIIDLTLILPLCSLISIARGSGELAVSASSVSMDMKICLIVICIAVLPTIITQKFQRWQGILLLLTYGGYIYFVVK